MTTAPGPSGYVLLKMSRVSSEAAGTAARRDVGLYRVAFARMGRKA